MSDNKKNKGCIVVFSGGQDSTVCLHWAITQFDKVQAVFFNYGQRHKIEQESASKICELNKIPLKIFNLNFFSELGGNSLTDTKKKIETPKGKLPNTFVPGRNLIFLTQAASYGFLFEIYDLVTGVCETDFSGYPDCRLNTINSLESTLSLGMEKKFKIHTPLMDLSKKQTVDLGIKLGAMESLAYSHTCYEGKFPPCGSCPSCKLREKGFELAGINDPLLERAKTG